MTFGYHTLTWANTYKNYEIKQAVREIRESGFSGIEFVEPLSKLGSAEEMAKLLGAEGMRLASVSCNLNMDAGDFGDIEETISRIKFAHLLGAKDVMVCGGWNSAGAEKRGEFYKILADKLGACCEYAAKLGVNVAFHPHRDTIVETAADIEALLAAADNTKLCLDIAHLAACGSDPVHAIKIFKDAVTYVHLKDWDVEKDDFVELGRGEVDIMKCLEALREIGYAGWAVVELDRTSATPPGSAMISADYLKRAGVL